LNPLTASAGSAMLLFFAEYMIAVLAPLRLIQSRRQLNDVNRRGKNCRFGIGKI
jgi:hypothetical protein